MTLWWVVPAITFTAGLTFGWRLLTAKDQPGPAELPSYRPTIKAIQGIVRDYPVMVSTRAEPPPSCCVVCPGEPHPAHGVAYWFDRDGVVQRRAWCVLALRPLLVSTVSRAAGGIGVELYTAEDGGNSG